MSQSPSTWLDRIKADRGDEHRPYVPLPTLAAFHKDGSSLKAVIGPVGSGKTTALAWEICYYVPYMLQSLYGIDRSRWVVVRNTYRELVDTTMATVLDWFGWGDMKQSDMTLTLRWPDGGPLIEVLFRACDRPQDLKKFKSLEITGYWIDESIEVAHEIKRMLRNRIGRYPSFAHWIQQLCRKYTGLGRHAAELRLEDRKQLVQDWMVKNGVRTRFGFETTNPPDVDHPTYSEWDWQTDVPGPMPKAAPKKGYHGYWQPPGENKLNLRPGYYEDLMEDYKDAPDWVAMYVEGKPGIVVTGKLVYANFSHSYHMSKAPLIYMKGATLIRGWDNSGNLPAAVVLQMPQPGMIHILREYWHDKAGIVDFTRTTVTDCAVRFPGAQWVDWCDPAGFTKYSKREGGFTSNAELMREECGVECMPSEQNQMARIQAVDQALGRRDGILIDPSCTRLINGFLGGYHYPEIGTSGRYSDNPEKNRFSHLQDALQYALVKIMVSTKRRSKPERVPQEQRSWRVV